MLPARPRTARKSPFRPFLLHAADLTSPQASTGLLLPALDVSLAVDEDPNALVVYAAGAVKP